VLPPFTSEGSLWGFCRRCASPARDNSPWGSPRAGSAHTRPAAGTVTAIKRPVSTLWPWAGGIEGLAGISAVLGAGGMCRTVLCTRAACLGLPWFPKRQFLLEPPPCPSFPALRSDSGQDTRGCGGPLPPCWVASHITLGLLWQPPARALHSGVPRAPAPQSGGSEPWALWPLGVSWAAGGNDIPLEMGHLCSGRPEKSQGQRGEVMAAVSGVILLLHLQGLLSDSAFLFRPREPGNTHLRRLPSCPALPCAAVRAARGGGTEPGRLSRRCPGSVGTTGKALCQCIPNLQG